MTALNDLTARQQAINPEESFAVSAPAGSGKTELLIQRILSLLGRVNAPEEILAITFTRKAANEMRERVLLALTAAAQNQPVESEHEQISRKLALNVLQKDKELGWGLLDNPGRIGIQTIDGFCLKLANQLCMETGITLPPNMSSDNEALYRQASERLLEYMDTDGAIGDALTVLIRHLDGHLDKLCSLVAQLLASRDSWLPVIFSGQLDEEYLTERLISLVNEELSNTLSVLIPYAGDIEEMLDYACLHKDDASRLKEELIAELPEPDHSLLPKWRALASFFLDSKGQIRSSSAQSVNKSLGFPTESEHADKNAAKARKMQMQLLLDDLRQDESVAISLNKIGILPDVVDSNSHTNVDQKPDPASQINQALMTLLPVAAAEFSVLAQERGETDFTAIAMAAMESLGSIEEPTVLALKMDYRIQHILVDEFQDTSAIQVGLLERLTAGWVPGDGRTLFIVGDGMQSIYGFRKANVGLFIKARRFGIGDVPLTALDLSANFRSDGQIVDWVNQTFKEIFPAKDNLGQGQVAFTQAQAIHETSKLPIQINGHASVQKEAEYIAADIAKKITGGAENIAILVRARPHLSTILPALRGLNISWQAQDIDPLVSRMAVTDLHSLTRAICTPADRIAWLSVLRTPWAGLNQSDLLALSRYSEEGDEYSLWHALKSVESIKSLSPEGKKICQRLVCCFSSALDQLGQINLRANIERLWRELDGPLALLEARDLQDAKDYLDLLEKQQAGGMIHNWPAFERQLKKLYSKPEANSGTAKVKILTIHSAKGLDFDHVYLPALERTQNSNEDPLLLWWLREFEDGSEGYLLAAKPDSSDRDKQTLYSYLKAEEAERQRQETARLLYVATTRARKSLNLSAVLKWNDNKEQISNPTKGSMLNILWELYEEEFCHGYSPENEAIDKELIVLDGIRRLSPFRESPARKNDLAAGIVEANVADDSDNLLNNSLNNYNYQNNYIARICGDIIHHSLMRIVREEIKNPDIEDFKSDWQQKLAISGLSEKDQKTAIERLGSMLSTIKKDKVGKWIIDPSHNESAAELEMDYLDAKGRIQLAIIDRTFIDKGIRWVIDYKSSQPANDQSLEEFLASETNEYRAQLKRYKSLFDEEVKSMLYFPAIPASIEVSNL